MEAGGIDADESEGEGEGAFHGTLPSNGRRGLGGWEKGGLDGSEGEGHGTLRRTAESSPTG
jgi:hypothetical protein